MKSKQVELQEAQRASLVEEVPGSHVLPQTLEDEMLKEANEERGAMRN